MKKIISLLLVVAMMCSLSSPVFAATANSSPADLEEAVLQADKLTEEEIEALANKTFNYLTKEQQAVYIDQIEALAVAGDTSLVEFHHKYVDSSYRFDPSNVESGTSVTRSAALVAGQLQALNLPTVVYNALIAFAAALAVPAGNLVDIVIGLGLGVIIVANWDAIKDVWDDIVDIFVDAFGAIVMDAFYYLQGLVGVYDVDISGDTVTINGEEYECDTNAQIIATTMRPNGHTYYPAFRSGSQVLVAPVDIPRKAALAVMKKNDEYIGIFTIADNYASSLCTSLGGGIRGPETSGSSSGYWWHYHSNNYPKAHCWYIS